MKKFLVGFMVLAFSWSSMGSYALANNFSPIQSVQQGGPSGQQGAMTSGQQQGTVSNGQGQSGNRQNINTSSSATTSKIPVYINGVKQNFSSDPVNMNGSVLVPMRNLFEAVGGNVQWDDATRTVTGNRGNTNVKLSIGSNSGYVNNSQQQLNTAPQLINGNTYIPLRFLCEAFGATVDWENGVINIQLPENSGSYYSYNQNDDLDDISAALNDSFEDAGDAYFGDDDIDCTISLSGNENYLAYKIFLDFADADDYDDLAELDEDYIESFLDDLADAINDEIDGTDYEDADITGKLLDNDNSGYYVIYDGNDYDYSW